MRLISSLKPIGHFMTGPFPADQKSSKELDCSFGFIIYDSKNGFALSHQMVMDILAFSRVLRLMVLLFFLRIWSLLKQDVLSHLHHSLMPLLRDTARTIIGAQNNVFDHSNMA